MAKNRYSWIIFSYLIGGVKQDMFKLENVCYGSILRVDSLSISKGIVTCVVGPSGSGKTTLLRLLTHLISPDSGSIFYRGTNLRDIDPVDLRREVVMLPQTPVIFPGTVADNLTAGCRFSERPIPPEAQLKSVLAGVGLNQPLSSGCGGLSGGERQRLALARVLLMQPPVLLLDEPSSALDDDTERLIFDLLAAEVADHGRTLVMVTHSRALAREYAHEIITIVDGSVTGKEVVCR